MTTMNDLAEVLARYRQTVIDTDQVKVPDLLSAERILADPASLLDALGDAGVLGRTSLVLRTCGCRVPEGDISACCYERSDRDDDVPLIHYAAEVRA